MKPHLLFLCFLLLTFSAHADPTTEPEHEHEHSESSTTLKKGTLFSAFAQSFSSIIVSELGDKTFFISAIMAMRYSRIAVLCGALLALFLMTAISTAFGSIVPTILPPSVTHVLITILFFFFGGKLLYDAYSDTGEESTEQAEVEIELNQIHSKLVRSAHSQSHGVQIEYISHEKDPINNPEAPNGDLESTNNIKENKRNCATHIERVATKMVFWQALTMTFLGEWGDRSQISTIALAADAGSYSIFVFIGGFLGHVLCTSLAVAGGKFLAKKISERTVNICGGILFLMFGIHNLFLK